ncbi:type III restriction-modification system endonuclease [Streptococcus pseudopneumoniae]|uniref:type III restriction-modification system endonuclease n=1 Tax=Streptococcus pseudopneumoniae TaxID=257758 RepID=UPI0018B0D110|nr:DEAD/DEAH box helicase family protein [Streptococcus pseudopneumoniae]MBF9684750.1 DEAD/DEAH box helicase family protein [Streptococcus pseudopneumoniae]
MKLQFKKQQFQLDAVSAIADLFQGQAKHTGVRYMADPGRLKSDEVDLVLDAYRNAPIQLSQASIRENVHAMQTRYGLRPSDKLSIDMIAGREAYNFSIEMETGTGKTYTYIRTIMELNKRYGWLKFVIVVPSVAIREGVLKSLQIMSSHFQMEYGKQPRYFVYDSSRLGDLDSFTNSSDLQIMVINSQAFNAKGKDARRIHSEQESFRWRRPIDVLAAMNPIMIIDEPQSVEGKQTKERLKDFKPLFTLRYSATHKEKHDMVYRLDAMDAYNQKLVKKIAVKAIEQTGTTGTQGYLYLQEIIPQKTGAPKAKIEFEVKTQSGVKRKLKVVEEPFDLYAESGNLSAYKGMTLSHFDARENKLQVGVTQELHVGEVIGEVDESSIRRIQIRETIKSHLEKESKLYNRRIKVLSLFFIDEVAKYKQYDEHNDAYNDAYNGEYAQIFEEEYRNQVNQFIRTQEPTPYRRYLEANLEGNSVHAGYFSVDKVKKSDKTIFVDYKSASEKKSNLSNDTDAYDLIMKDKERLLSFEEPVRFLFSHSALKEGWDNPNVFQICTLKQSSAETRKRQEIGRGMRLAVDQNGIRQDFELLGNDVHEINKLTVIANESYDQFARSLQEEIKELLADRPAKVDVSLFANKVLTNQEGQTIRITKEQADSIHFDLIRQGYIDREGQLTTEYFTAKENHQLQLSETLAGYEDKLVEILESVYHVGQYEIENANHSVIQFSNEVNQENIARKEFLNLWKQINRKTSYQVEFDDAELVKHSVDYINEKLVVSKPSFQITQASAADMSKEEGLNFTVAENDRQQEYLTDSQIMTKYDLLGEIAEQTGLTRKLVAEILSKIYVYQFDKFKQNPEEFILKVSKLINEQKASQIIKHIQYNVLNEEYDMDLFYDNPETANRSDDHLLESKKGIYNFVKVDSNTEKTFKESLEQYEDVRVYVKLPGKFSIATPLGNYNPDWAIAFREGSVKHIYFVAETKGSMSSLQLKQAEQAKISCARAHFKALAQAGLINDQHIYDVVSSYEELLNIVR